MRILGDDAGGFGSSAPPPHVGVWSQVLFVGRAVVVGRHFVSSVQWWAAALYAAPRLVERFAQVPGVEGARGAGVARARAMERALAVDAPSSCTAAL